jgi:branched-chain amino acid transport system substrate-binding protein
MTQQQILDKTIGRRTVLKAATAAGVLQLGAPFIRTAQAADPVLIGLDNPLTGTYAINGKNELNGCELAIEQINAKGGTPDEIGANEQVQAAYLGKAA